MSDELAERAEKFAELSSFQEQVLGPELVEPRLLELLDDADAELRAEACTAAWNHPGRPAVVEKVLGLAESDPDDLVRLAALESLGRVVLEGSLFRGAESESGEPTGEHFERAVGVLKGALVREGEEFRREVVLALSPLSGDAEVVAAIEGLAGAEEEDREQALRCMGRSGDGRYWGRTIVEALRRGEPHLQALAAEAAGEAEVWRAVDDLLRLLVTTQDPMVRDRVVEALSRMGRRVGAKLLTLAEVEGEVGRSASRALEGLGVLSEA